MRKRIIAPREQENAVAEGDWLDLEGLAEVEVSSEHIAHPIEAALIPGRGSPGRPTAVPAGAV
jgi:hypothetical protein